MFPVRKLSNAPASLFASSSSLRFIGWSSVLRFPLKDGLEHVCIKGETTLASLFAKPGDNFGRPVKVNSHTGFSRSDRTKRFYAGLRFCHEPAQSTRGCVH
jgi:hypothetical protein